MGKYRIKVIILIILTIICCSCGKANDQNLPIEYPIQTPEGGNRDEEMTGGNLNTDAAVPVSGQQEETESDEPGKAAAEKDKISEEAGEDTYGQQEENPIEKQEESVSGEPKETAADSEKMTLTASRFIDTMNIGWNLGDHLGSSTTKEPGLDANLKLETAWGHEAVTEELIDYALSFGFNTIRIPVTWFYNCGRDADGHLVIGEKWLERVHEVVDYAMDNDVYVIINTMCDGLNVLPGNLFYAGAAGEEWTQMQQDAADLWRQIAESFRDYNQNLMFESYNEIGEKAGWAFGDSVALSVGQVNKLNQIFVDAVRATGGKNEERVLIVPTLYDSTNEKVLDLFVLPEDTAKDKLVVTVHAYDWEFNQDLDWIFEKLAQFSYHTGAPVLIGEFGANSKTSALIKEDGWIEKYTSNFVARAQQYGIKCCIWDDGYNWGLIDRKNPENSRTSVLNALFEGVKGIAYESTSENRTVYDNIEDFLIGSYSLSGVLNKTDYSVAGSWAGLLPLSEEGDYKIPVEEGDYISVSMVTKNEAADFWIYTLVFLDENGDMLPVDYQNNPIVGKNILHKYMCAQVPESAAYVVVNSYDPYRNHSLEKITSYLESGNLQMTITISAVTDLDSLKQVQLPVENIYVPEPVRKNEADDKADNDAVSTPFDELLLKGILINNDGVLSAGYKEAVQALTDNVIIPEGITEIAAETFKNSGISSVVIPESVKSIGSAAFEGCKNLTAVENNSLIVSEAMFKDCTSLISISFAEAVVEIGASAFEGCTALEEIALPKRCYAIGKRSFYGCTSLTEITLNSTMNAIRAEAFRNCSNFRLIYWNEGTYTNMKEFAAAFQAAGHYIELAYNNIFTDTPFANN